MLDVLSQYGMAYRAADLSECPHLLPFLGGITLLLPSLWRTCVPHAVRHRLCWRFSALPYHEPPDVTVMFYKLTLRTAWLRAHIHAFEYFGGVPRLVVPDNPRTGLSRACHYDPDLNRS